MENAKQMILAVDELAKASEEIRVAWEGAVSPEMAREVDAEGAFVNLLGSVIGQSTSAREKWAQACGLTLDSREEVAPFDPREYHIREFFDNLVYDENGAVIDRNAHYFDQYRVNKKLSMVSRRSESIITESAQAVITAFQSGASDWGEDLSALALELLQPILNDAASLVPMLNMLAEWHETLMRQNLENCNP